MKIIIYSLLFISFILGCSNTSSTSSDDTEDLHVTSSMRSLCPDTTGDGLLKTTVSTTGTISCETWLWDYKGNHIAHHIDSGDYDTESYYSTTCSNASVYNDLKEYNKSGFYFFKIKTIIDGNDYEQLNCYYVDMD